jgi:hypothetical protein
MYGLNGSFGGMPYQSPGSAIVGGIEAGQSFMLRAQDAADRREQMQYERDREDRLDQMHQAQIDFAQRHIQDETERQHQIDALNSLKEEGGQLDKMMQATIQKYGSYDKVPSDEQNVMTAAVNSHRARMSSVQGAIYGQFQQDEVNWQKGYLKKLQSGNFDPTSEPGGEADFFRFLNGVGVNHPADYLPGPNGEPSKIGQHIEDYNDGTQNGDKPLAISGVQGVLGNQVNVNLGQLNPAGGVITERALHPDIGAVPTPDGTAAMPVTVTQAQHSDGSVSTDPMAPHVNGGNHPDDPISTITPQALNDHMGMQGTLNSIVAASKPLQDMIRRQSAKPPQEALDWAQSVTARGLSSTPTTWKSDRAPDGSLVNREYNSNGMTTGKFEVLEPPNAKPREPTEADRKELAARRLVGTINPETNQPYTQADVDRQTVFGASATPKSNISEADINDTKDSVQTALGMVKNPMSGVWTDSTGAIPDWRLQAQQQAATNYVESVLRNARINKKPVDMDQVRAMAIQRAQMETHDVPTWEPGTMHQFPMPAPDDGKPSIFRGRYKGGDPRKTENYTDIRWTPVEAPPTSTNAGKAVAAGAVKGPTPAQVVGQPQAKGIQEPETADIGHD